MSQTQPADERATLVAYLDVQRRHVLGILEGLPEEELRRPVLPSGWTCLGLVNHLAVDVERFWFRAVVAGEQPSIDEALQEGDAWKVAPDVPASEVFDLYRREIERANEIINTTPIGAAPTWWPDFFGGFRLDNLQEVILHVMVETACHAGHVDVVREIIDGRQWMVLTE